MATRQRRNRGGARQVNASAQEFAQAVAGMAADRLRETVPSREEFRELKRTVRELQKALQSCRGADRPRKAGRPRSNRKCEVSGCSRPHVARGYCSMHYQARRREELAAPARKPVKKKNRKR